MAMIQTIRNNFSWLLIILIGLGLGGFLLMDMMSGQTSVFGAGQTTLGEIGDRKVNVQEFDRTFNIQENVLYRGANGGSLGRRARLWDYYVEDAILSEEAEELGLGVSSEEFQELTFGPNFSPVIAQRFPGQVPGQADGAQIRQTFDFIKSGGTPEQPLDPNFRSYWAFQEKEITKDRVQQKLVNLVTKGLYTPGWMAEMLGSEQSQRVDFAYVQIPFDAVPASEVSLTDADYEQYLSANAARFRQNEETRNAEYVVFDVYPTAADTAAVRRAVTDLKTRFEGIGDDDLDLFVQNNGGTPSSTYQKRADLSTELADFAFSSEVGSVYGPYRDGGSFKLAKLVDRKVIPDSVRARHILLPLDQQNPAAAQATVAQANSYKEQIESGAERFDSLAVRYSTDGSASQGGDLGFFAPGRMVAPFNDAVFYQAEGDEVMVVPSQFGVHVIQVTDRKFLDQEESVRLAEVSQNITPSRDTEKAVENRALTLLEENRTIDALRQAVANDPELEMETATGIKRNDFAFSNLGSDQETRDMVKYLYTADAGDVSPLVYRFSDPVDFYTNKYVITALESTQEAGLPRWQSVRNQIEPLVLNEKRAAVIRDQVSGQDLQAIANKYSVTVDTATSVNFGNGFIAGLGQEPKVVSTAFGSPLNQVSTPVVGNNGVYVVKRTSEPTTGAAANVADIRRNQRNALQSQVRAGLLPALRENMEIEDNRSRFF